MPVVALAAVVAVQDSVEMQGVINLIFAFSHFFVLFEHCRNSFYGNLRGSS